MGFLFFDIFYPVGGSGILGVLLAPEILLSTWLYSEYHWLFQLKKSTKEIS
jgi:hypothetical protein